MARLTEIMTEQNNLIRAVLSRLLEMQGIGSQYYAGFGLLAKFQNVKTRHGASLQRLQSGKIVSAFAVLDRE